MPPRTNGRSPEREAFQYVERIPDPRNRATAVEFLRERQLTDEVKGQTLKNSAMACLSLARWLHTKRPGVAFRDVAPRDMKEYILDIKQGWTDWEGTQHRPVQPTTRANRQICILTFYKWLHYPDEYARGPAYREEIPVPKPVEHFIEKKGGGRSLRSQTERAINREELLDEKEVMLLIESCDHPRDKALCAVLWDAGFRISEALALNVRSYRYFSDKRAELILPGVSDRGEDYKTPDAQRAVRVTVAMPYLRALMDMHPFGDHPDAPLFYSTNNAYFPALTRKAGRIRAALADGKKPPETITASDLELLRLSEEGARAFFRRLLKRCGLQKKRLTPHLFRHSRATYYAGRGVSDAILRKIFGWTKNSNMPSKYVHAARIDVDREVLRAQGLEPDDADADVNWFQPRKCRNGHVNAPDARFCMMCALPLDPEKLRETAQAQSTLAGTEEKPERILQELQMKVAWLHEKLGLTEDGKATQEAADLINLAEARLAYERAGVKAPGPKRGPRKRTSS